MSTTYKETGQETKKLIMEFYDQILIKELNLSWFEVQKKYQALGSEPGIYPDSIILLWRLIEYFNIKEVSFKRLVVF